MTLFDDQAATDFRRAKGFVEDAIRSLGVDPLATRSDDSDGTARWTLTRGSAAILVAVFPPGEGGARGTVRVAAPVIRLPNGSREALFERLLRANVEDLTGVAFGLIADRVVLLAERSLEDLDQSEVDILLRAVGREADRFDDLLAREFDAVRASDD